MAPLAKNHQSCCHQWPKALGLSRIPHWAIWYKHYYKSVKEGSVFCVARLFDSCGFRLSNKRPITANIITNGKEKKSNKGKFMVYNGQRIMFLRVMDSNLDISCYPTTKARKLNLILPKVNFDQLFDTKKCLTPLDGSWILENSNGYSV